MYYVISLKHTHRQDAYVIFWQDNYSCYTNFKERAGVYAELKEWMKKPNLDSMPVKIEELDMLFIPIENEKTGEVRHFIPNTPDTWKALGVKMTKRGLVPIMHKK